MDKRIEQKKWTKKRIAFLAGGGLLFVLLITFGFQSRESSFETARSRVNIESVIEGDFQEMVSFLATVEPENTIQLDATEGGIVEEIFVEDGQQLQAGQPILRLSNTSLRLDFMNRETQIVEQINNLRSTRITLEQNKRLLQQQLIDISYQLDEQKRQFNINSSLYSDSVISQNDFDAARANFKYLKEKKQLLKEQLNTDERYRQNQLQRIDNSVEMMERNLSAIRKNLENLTIKAPIAGQLNSFDHEVGQTKAKGENIGRIDVLGNYILSAQIDQYHLNRIEIGQRARATFNNQNFVLTVSKIFPTIENGQFEIRLKFMAIENLSDSTSNNLPQNIRRGQNVQSKIELGSAKTALLVPRGAFSQSNAGNYVYVVEGNAAYKRKVKLGKQNSDYIEIIEGLVKGEQVVTSSYSTFGGAQKLVLTQ